MGRKRMSRNMSGSRSNKGVEDVFARSQRERIEDEEEEEALRWAALENKMDVGYRQVDVRKLSFMERQAFIDRVFKRIPKWWSWYYWICPLSWTIYSLIASQYGDVTDPLKVLGEGTKPLNKFIDDYFGYRHDFLGAVAAALVGFSVLFAFVFAFGIKVLNFQHR